MTDFHTLYESYSPLVRRFALFLCGDHALADDITSETFVRAWTSPGPIRQETIKAYLFTIARNLHRDFLRQARRHTTLDESLSDAQVSAPELAEAQSELRHVLEAMQDLPRFDRAVLMMRAWEEKSYEEIAQALGLSAATVRVKVHRARLKIMKSLNAKDPNNFRGGEGS